MTLDKNKDLFTDAVQAASEYLKISPVYIEKDYWITKLLQRLSRSEYKCHVVWKGGTSLSKGYGIIDRFSSDIDIAVLTEGMNGSQIKSLLSKVDKQMSEILPEREVVGETSKGSRYRKTYHFYDSISNLQDPKMSLLGNYVVVEINSFANPYPYQSLPISSFISLFMREKGLGHLVEQYDMASFELNVLDKRRTVCEKTTSLIRYSFQKNPIEGLKKKIRHFYDLYFLLQQDDVREYTRTDFIMNLTDLIRHDQQSFDEPSGWQEHQIEDSPLLNDFDALWQTLQGTYKDELSQLAYKPIPEAWEIKATMDDFLTFVRKSIQCK